MEGSELKKWFSNQLILHECQVFYWDFDGGIQVYCFCELIV